MQPVEFIQPMNPNIQRIQIINEFSNKMDFTSIVYHPNTGYLAGIGK